MLESLSNNEPQKYQIFWNEFGQILKEGPAEDITNKDRIIKLLRFSSTHSNELIQNVSIKDYLNRVKSNKQDKIYYIASDTFIGAKNSPHLEIFNKNNIEVLLLTDRVDEWLMNHLVDFRGKKFQSIAKGKLDNLNDTCENDKLLKDRNLDIKVIIDKMKKILYNKVKDIRITNRLINSPSCIVVDESDLTPQMERIMKTAGQNVNKSKPILEINPNHKIIKNLFDSKDIEIWTNLLFDQAILSSGGQLEDPVSFIKRFNSLIV